MAEKINKLIVASKQWYDTIPDWLLQQVALERLVLSFQSERKGGPQPIGDAEVVVYLYTLGLACPLNASYANIYLYLGHKVMASAGRPVSADMKKNVSDKLSIAEQQDLDYLRRTLYHYRGDVETIFTMAGRIFRAFKPKANPAPNQKLEEKVTGDLFSVVFSPEERHL